MEDGLVCHSSRMCVVCHGYDWLGGFRDGCGGWVQGWMWWMVCMQDKSKAVGRMLGDAGAHPDCDMMTPITPDHTIFQVCNSGSSRDWSVFLGRPKHGTPHEGFGSLSLQPVGYTPWCSMDMLLLLLLWLFQL